MTHYRDDNSSQPDEDLRHLEDDHERDREREDDRGRDREKDGERPRGRGPSLRELPKPIYRIKATHSNETFFAYFVAPQPAVSRAAAPEAQADQTRAEDAAEGPATETAAAAAAAGDSPGAAPETLESAAPTSDAPESDAPSIAEGAALWAAASGGEGGGAASAESGEGPAAAAGEGAAGTIPPRTMVVAPTRYGRDLCELQGIVAAPGSVGYDEIVRIERIADAEDLQKYEANKERERKAYEACKQKIVSRNLPMKLVSAHYLLDEPKLLFYFSAETRVDFRELVKDLVSVFKMRIELRQIGVRDEARVTGGCGVCGRVLCCHGVTDKLVPVSIKMAKDQNLSLNSMKISGPCGRLLCCLAYEYGFYRDARRELPNEGARFTYDGTLFRVIEVNALAGSVKMAGEDGRILDMPAARFAYADGRWQVRQEDVT